MGLAASGNTLYALSGQASGTQLMAAQPGSIAGNSTAATSSRSSSIHFTLNISMPVSFSQVK